MKRINKNVIGLSLSLAFVLSSCGDDFDFESHYPGGKEKQEYTKNWVEQFGEIDPNHTWNACKSYEITVSTPESSNIQIYALEEGTYRIVANYEDVMGEQTLKFDAQAGVTDIYVSNGMTAVPAKVGDTVKFGGTRSGIYHKVGSVETVRTEYAEWKTFTQTQYQAWESVVPQATKNRGKAGLTQNFTYTATSDEIIIYPVLWGTSQYDTFGIYLIGSDGNKTSEITFYEPKIGGATQELQYYNGSAGKQTVGGTKNDEINSQDENIYKNSERYKQIVNSEEYVEGSFTPATYDTNGNMKASASYYNWVACPDQQYIVGSGGVNPAIQKLRSKGIKIKIGQGTRFGMYLHNNGGGIGNSGNRTFYSETKYNSDTYYRNYTPRYASMAATFEVGGILYFGMEDRVDDTVPDLNDVIFCIEGVTPLDNDADEWTIACEDLGESDDYDFNDLVFKVSHISGETKAYITPLAAGGVLEAHYGFDNAKTVTTGNEIHGKFTKNSQTAGIDPEGKYYMINTNYDGTHDGYSAGQEEITVLRDFSLAENMGGFWIKVKEEEGTNYQLVTAPISRLHSGTEGSIAPQMILVPYGWKWPKERVSISEAYPDFFQQYNKDQTTAENLAAWNSHLVTNKVYQYNY